MSQGHRTIKKEQHGFWTCKLDKRKDPITKNPFVFPSRVVQVLFVSDQSSPDWKVIIFHKPRSWKIIGEREQYVFARCGGSINVDDILPSYDTQPKQQQ